MKIWDSVYVYVKNKSLAILKFQIEIAKYCVNRKILCKSHLHQRFQSWNLTGLSWKLSCLVNWQHWHQWGRSEHGCWTRSRTRLKPVWKKITVKIHAILEKRVKSYWIDPHCKICNVMQHLQCLHQLFENTQAFGKPKSIRNSSSPPIIFAGR